MRFENILERLRRMKIPFLSHQVTCSHLVACMRRRQHHQACYERWSAGVGGKIICNAGRVFKVLIIHDALTRTDGTVSSEVVSKFPGARGCT